MMSPEDAINLTFYGKGDDRNFSILQGKQSNNYYISQSHRYCFCEFIHGMIGISETSVSCQRKEVLGNGSQVTLCLIFIFLA